MPFIYTNRHLYCPYYTLEWLSYGGAVTHGLQQWAAHTSHNLLMRVAPQKWLFLYWSEA